MKLSLSVAVLAGLAASVSAGCTLSEDGVTYDLSELENLKVLTVKGGDLDYTAEKEEIYEYHFAICRDLSSDEKEPSCSSKGEGAVYQVGPEGAAAKTCHLAGKAKESTLQLSDNTNKAYGVRLTYEDGDQCSHLDNQGNKCGGETGIDCPKRTTTINFICADEGAFHPGQAAEIDENGQIAHCKYQIEVKSMHACPSECGISFNEENKRKQLCAGHGVCSWDQTNQKAKCFCDDGYMGKDCATKGTPTTTSSSGGVKGLVILLLLLTLGLIGVIVFMAKQVRAYRADATNYMQIRGQELSEQMSTI